MVDDIVPDDDEDLIRVYARYKKQTRTHREIVLRDFARSMTRHSGISVWQLSLRTRQDAKDALHVPENKAKGTLIIKAKQLKELGLRFVDSPGNGHIAMRCVDCNMEKTKDDKRCQPVGDKGCGLDLEAESSICSILTSMFQIDEPIE